MDRTRTFFSLWITTILPAFLPGQVNLDSLHRVLPQTHCVERVRECEGIVMKNYYDGENRLKYILVTEESGQFPGSGLKGVFAISHSYDELNRLQETRRYDARGYLYTDEEKGVSGITRRYYDSPGRLVRQDDFRSENEPVKKYARRTLEYDASGNVIETRLYDGNYELAGGDMCIRRYRYNQGGRVVLRRDYRKDNSPVVRNGVATVYKKYATAKRERVLEMGCYDEQKKLTDCQEDPSSKSGYAFVRYVYKKTADKVLVMQYNADKELVHTFETGVSIDNKNIELKN